MLEISEVRELLSPFGVSLSDDAVSKLIDYLALLLRWNRKINLTAIMNPEDCITRHFGESLLMSRLVPLQGRLLDIGSGAGFPGLALKLIAPSLEVFLLEPVAKKRSFLKEVARTCGMGAVRVIGSRLDEFAAGEEPHSFDLITARAVGGLELLIPIAAGLLKPGGALCLWVGSRQVDKVRGSRMDLQWQEPVSIPLSDERQLLMGKAKLV